MQIYADVTRLPLSVLASEQGPALGAAIHAAVAAGAYADVPLAAKSMGKVRRGVYLPDESRSALYDRLFEHYLELHDHFGRSSSMMRQLKRIRRDAVQRHVARTTAAATRGK
jgi:L-ribulokinase